MFSALFSFNGRLNRAPFWGFTLLLALAMLLVESVVMSSVLGPPLAAIVDQLSKGQQPSLGDIANIASAVGPGVGWTGLVLQFVFSYPAAALCIKRRHDRNRSGIDVWIYIGIGLALGVMGFLGIGYTTTQVEGVALPKPEQWLQAVSVVVGIFGLYLFIVLAFLKGTIGPNNYGPDPLQG